MNTRRSLGLLAMILVCSAAPMFGTTDHDTTDRDTTAHDNGALDYFTDVELINQEGETFRLYSDLMKDKVVVISVIFTTCDGVCPVTMGNLVKLQKWLGPRLGEDVLMLSLTVDREVDTPEKLREYAVKFKTKPGWHFLTGTPENLDTALRKLGLWVQHKESHSTTFLVGNVNTGLWKKAFGMAPAADLITILDSVLEDRLETESQKPQAEPAAGR